MNINGKSLVELAQELQRQAQVRRDFLAPTDQVGYLVADNGSTALALNGAAFEVTNHTHRQVSEWAGIPAKYYDRMRTEAPRLLEANVQHWFKENPTKRLIRTLDGNARAFLSDKYQRVDNDQVAEAALSVILESGGFEVVSSNVTDSRLYIQATITHLEGEVKKGDAVRAGIIISNGELGNGAIDIQPMIYRLVCTNGMVAGSLIQDARFRRNHVGRRMESNEDYSIYADDTRQADDRTLMLKIRDSIRALSDPALFHRLMDELRASTEGPRITNPVAAVEELASHYQLRPSERNTVLENLIRGADYSRWGAANAITAAANTHESYDRSIELENFGGKLISLQMDQWSRITEAEPVLA